MSGDLPPGPPVPEPVRRELAEKPKGRWWAVALVVVIFAGACIAVAGYLYTPGVMKPVAKESPSEAPRPINNDNPCGHETFDTNACAVRIIQVAAQQYQVPPAQVVSAFCQRWETAKMRRSQIQTWVSQGAYPREARAVLAKIMDYCPA